MIKVLDHGYLTLIEAYGGDERIIEAARMSTGKGFLGWGSRELGSRCGRSVDAWSTPPTVSAACPCGEPGCEIVRRDGDEKLLRYLWKNNHATPFEMAGAIIEVQAPILVFREWHRHRTQSYNELSARYTPLPDVNYMPTPERCMIVSGTNKQAGKAEGAAELTHEKVLAWLERLAQVYAHAQSVYEEGLAIGIPKEIARCPVPVARYSRMRASANLRNWLAFLTLREAPNAQLEIRLFANALHAALKTKFPRTLELFELSQCT